MNQPRIAVLIPCYNEALTITKVVQDFKSSLPQAVVYVYDNNSSDGTAELAREAGAIVKHEPRQGKGNVVRSMFRDIEADVYVMVDGDDTYPAESVNELIVPVIEHSADLVTGDRLSNNSYKENNTRNFHFFGNWLVRTLINKLFGSNLKDIMSGYRVFNRRFVKNYPVLSPGFELETNITIFALHRSFKIEEKPIMYRDRPEGSFSKLNTFRDGMLVLKTILSIFQQYKPLIFYNTLSLAAYATAIALVVPVLSEYMQTGLVERFPTAFLSLGLCVLGFTSNVCGVVLNSISSFNRENFEIQLKSYDKEY